MHTARSGPKIHSRPLSSVSNMRIRLLTIAALAAVSILPASAVDVVANDGTDTYTASGAVILSADFPAASDAAQCSGCHWRIIGICTGSLDDHQNCLGLQCPAGTRPFEVWRADAPIAPIVGDPAWTYGGIACLGGPPLPADALRSSAYSSAQAQLPALRPAAQPAAATLTGLPVYMRTNQPGVFRSNVLEVAGTTVTVTAYPTWTWDFGDGGALSTADPGGLRPHKAVRHTYSRRGLVRVRVSATWSATYAVRGISDLPLEPDLRQSAWFDLRVRESRRFLTQGVPQ